ncbi:MAG TPA: response regulator transcription factor [Gemmatimonadaceae bacterium]|nr:response regulator transcription factor [Gemmatimonadaceae bacterium]
MTRILVIEDNVDLARGLADNLNFEGFDVVVAHDGREGLEQARSVSPDLVILDLMLPELDGYRVLTTLRSEGNNVPVLILTARSEEVDKVRGFRFGADDYVTKPFGLLELLARISALLRRMQPSAHAASVPRDALPAESVASNGSASAHGGSASPSAALERIRFGDVEVLPAARMIYRRGFPVVLRPMEFELLAALLRRAGEVVTRVDLLREVWGYNSEVVSRTIDTHVAELRRKLEDDPSNPRHILTVRKAGYRLRVD